MRKVTAESQVFHSPLQKTDTKGKAPRQRFYIAHSIFPVPGKQEEVGVQAGSEVMLAFISLFSMRIPGRPCCLIHFTELSLLMNGARPLTATHCRERKAPVGAHLGDLPFSLGWNPKGNSVSPIV